MSPVEDAWEELEAAVHKTLTVARQRGIADGLMSARGVRVKPGDAKEGRMAEEILEAAERYATARSGKRPGRRQSRGN